MNQQLSNTLNLLRWIAALLVVVGHLRSFLFVGYIQVENKTILIKIFYFFTGFGHQAVIIFFVISGYLVGGAVLKKYKEKQIDKQYIILYFIKRFSRIYIVLVPALIIGFILDSIGYKIFPELYTNAYHISAMNFNVYEKLDFKIFLGDILNLQTILTSTLGSNGPLWSLANEWSYYILFILLFINNVTRIIFLVLFVSLVFLNSSLLIYGIIWLLGAFSVFIDKKIIHQFLSLFVFCAVFIFSRNISGLYIDLILGVSIVIFLNSLKYLKSDNIYFKNINHKLADFSYTVYLFHFPFFVFIISLFNYYDLPVLKMQPNLMMIFEYILGLLIIYFYTYIMYYIFEKKTNYLSNFLIEKFQ